MPLIASVSGIRGVFGDGLDPAALVRYASAFGAWLQRQTEGRPVVVVGRDGRVTGDVCARLVTATLQSAGCDVVDGGQATTPSVAMGVLKHDADGAVILSASHNPAEWNALKLLDRNGEFLGPDEGAEVLALADEGVAGQTVGYQDLGAYRTDDLLPYHVDKILALPYIDADTIRARGFSVVVDGINSVGAFAVPAMLEALGVTSVEVLNGDVTGLFAHDPEPLPAHITGITSRVAESGADLGVVVDPDADRLAFVEDGGRFFGEELTQVIAADFVLGKTPGAGRDEPVVEPGHRRRGRAARADRRPVEGGRDPRGPRDAGGGRGDRRRGERRRDPAGAPLRPRRARRRGARAPVPGRDGPVAERGSRLVPGLRHRQAQAAADRRPRRRRAPGRARRPLRGPRLDGRRRQGGPRRGVGPRPQVQHRAHPAGLHRGRALPTLPTRWPSGSRRS